MCACQQTTVPPRDQLVSAPPAKATSAPNSSTDITYSCPMDPDTISTTPGKCPRCGMALVAGIPDPIDFHLDLTISPKALHPNEQAQLTFEVFDPWKDR